MSDCREKDDSSCYLFRILSGSFLAAVEACLVFDASPCFYVTTHSFALPASSKPMMTALHRCKDMTFSKNIQITIKCKDLLDAEERSYRKEEHGASVGPWSSNGVEEGDDRWDVEHTPFWDDHFGEEGGDRDHDALEEEGHVVGDDPSREEEVVEQEEPLQQRHLLHAERKSRTGETTNT